MICKGVLHQETSDEGVILKRKLLFDTKRVFKTWACLRAATKFSEQILITQQGNSWTNICLIIFFKFQDLAKKELLIEVRLG